MIDLEKEREAFEYWAAYNGMGTYIYASLRKYSSNETEAAWSVWKIKQAEIDSLKAQLAKVNSGEFVVVPKIELMTVIGNCSDAMTDETTSSVYDKTGEPSTWYDHHIIAENKILAMIEAAQENSHE